MKIWPCHSEEGVLLLAELLKHAIRSLQAKRSDNNTDEQLKKCLFQAKASGLKIPDKRKTKVPQRIRHTDQPADEDLSQFREWKHHHLEVWDLVIAEIKRRFQQPGMFQAAKREQLLFSASVFLSKLRTWICQRALTWKSLDVI